MKVKIAEISVHERLRRESGDLAELCESIQTMGLIHPIVINEHYELLSGYRRLQACRELGWQEIDVRVVSTGGDKLLQLSYEYHENIGRSELTRDDIIAYHEIRERLKKSAAEQGWTGFIKRIWNWLKSLFGRVRKRER